MPRYFFNVIDDENTARDLEGAVFPELAAARREAQDAGREMIANSIRAGQEADGKRIEIVDDSGQVVERVRFADLLKKASHK